MPISSVVGMLMSGSTSVLTSSLRTSRYRNHGITPTFSTSVSPADTYRCTSFVTKPRIRFADTSATPCSV